MNGTEERYADDLERAKLSGEIIDWQFETMTFVLAHAGEHGEKGVRYTPDFVVFHKDGSIELVDVKGFMSDDALVKIKLAAEKFYWFDWTVTQARSKKDGGGWKSRKF